MSGFRLVPLFVLLLLGLTARSGVSQGRIVLQTVESPRIEARTVTLAPGESRLAVETRTGESRSVELADVIRVRFPAQKPNRPRKPTPRPGRLFEGPTAHHEVILVTGERIRGVIADGDEAGLTLKSPSLGLLPISIDTIAQVLVHENIPDSESREFPLQEETDTAYRRTSAGRDVIIGVLLEFGPESATFDTKIGEYSVNYRDLMAISLLPQIDLKPTEELLTEIECHDGTRLVGRLVSLTDRAARLTTRLDEERTVAVASMAALSIRNGRFRFLSDLTPVEVEQIPFIGDPDDFLFPYQNDRSVGGGPLRIGGRSYDRGIGVHSRCRLTYELGGQYTSFTAQIGVDDESLGLRVPGVVQFMVLVDGKTRFDSGLVRAGAPAVPVGPVDVKGAKRLTLFVDFGDDRHFGDRADWADALLIRE